jgi:hypothetical protein
MHDTPPTKMVNVLQFLGVKVTQEEAEEYIQNPHKLMVLPKFIAGFSNAALSPFIAGPDATEFANAMQQKVFFSLLFSSLLSFLFIFNHDY